MRLIIFYILLLSVTAYGQSYFKGPALIEGLVNNTVSGSTTSLTKDSQTWQEFSGLTNENLVLPDATTLPVGRRFEIINTSIGTITVKDNDSNVLMLVLSGDSAVVILYDNTVNEGIWFKQNLLSFALPTFPDKEVLFGDGSNTPVTSGGLTFTFASNALTVGTAASSTNASLALGGSGTGVGTFTGGGGGLNITSGPLSLATNSNSQAITLKPNGSTALTVTGAGNTTVANTLTVGTLQGSIIGTSGVISAIPGTTTTVLHGNAAGAPTFSAVTLTTDVTGILPVANGGSGTGTAFTQGSAIFAGSGGTFSQDNANYFWDATNHSLGLGNAVPGATFRLNVTGPELITSTSATALVVGANGTTNPALTIDGSTASSATGLRIRSQAAAGGVILDTTSSATNDDMNLRSKGTGTLNLAVTGMGVINLLTNNNTRVAVGATGNVTFTPAAASTTTSRIAYTGASDTALTANTNAPSVNFNIAQTRTHATGAITTQTDFNITPSTHAFAGASTITNAAGFSVATPPNGGTNATLTNSSAIYVPTASIANTGTGYGLNVAAPTGATTNYAAGFTGPVLVTGTASAPNGASLEVNSTTGTFLFPRMTSAQRTAITATNGSMVYDTDLSSFFCYSGSAWAACGGSTVQGTRASGTSISAGTAITPAIGQTTTAFIVGNGGAITVTASPPITVTSMVAGQELRLCGTSDTNTVSYTSSVNLVLNGDVTLGKDQCITFIYAGSDGSNSSWVETGRMN